MPESYRIIISPRAARDMVEICAYIERDSPQNAARVAERLLNAIDSLDIFPRRYRVHQHRLNPRRTVHSVPVWPHIIYYRVDDTNRIVRIMTVRHGRQRQPRRFDL